MWRRFRMTEADRKIFSSAPTRLSINRRRVARRRQGRIHLGLLVPQPGKTRAGDTEDVSRDSYQRFGLAYVDFADRKRTLKESGRWYGAVASGNGFEG